MQKHTNILIDRHNYELLKYLTLSVTIIVIHDDLISNRYWYQPLFLVSLSVISERCNQYCNMCTNNVIICTSLLIIFEKNVDIISDCYRYISKSIISL